MRAYHLQFIIPFAWQQTPFTAHSFEQVSSFLQMSEDAYAKCIINITIFCIKIIPTGLSICELHEIAYTQRHTESDHELIFGALLHDMIGVVAA